MKQGGNLYIYTYSISYLLMVIKIESVMCETLNKCISDICN